VVQHDDRTGLIKGGDEGKGKTRGFHHSGGGARLKGWIGKEVLGWGHSLATACDKCCNHRTKKLGQRGTLKKIGNRTYTPGMGGREVKIHLAHKGTGRVRAKLTEENSRRNKGAVPDSWKTRETCNCTTQKRIAK